MRAQEHFRLVCRLIELKSQKLKNGTLSVREQIKHDQLVGRIAYFSEASCRRVAKIIKKTATKGNLVMSENQSTLGVYEKEI